MRKPSAGTYNCVITLYEKCNAPYQRFINISDLTSDMFVEAFSLPVLLCTVSVSYSIALRTGRWMLFVLPLQMHVNFYSSTYKFPSMFIYRRQCVPPNTRKGTLQGRGVHDTHEVRAYGRNMRYRCLLKFLTAGAFVHNGIFAVLWMRSHIALNLAFVKPYKSTCLLWSVEMFHVNFISGNNCKNKLLLDTMIS